MNAIFSFVAGAAAMPLLFWLVRLVAETCESAGSARAVAALAVGAGALAGALVRGADSRGRRSVGIALVLVAVFGSALLAPSITGVGPAVAALPLTVFALGVAWLGGAVPVFAALLLGAAAGGFASAGWVLPKTGFLVPLLVAAPVFVGARLLSRAAPPGVPNSAGSLFELALAGLLLGAGSELFRPFALQHASGGAFSHAAFLAVALVGMGAAAIVPLPRPAPVALRIVLAVVGIAALAWTAQVLRNMADPRGLELAPLASEPDSRLAELGRFRVILGLAAVGAGLWLKPLFSAPLARRVAVFCVALSAGIAGAHVAIDGVHVPDSLWRRWVRVAQRERSLDALPARDGVLRLAGDPTLGQGSQILMWNGRDAARPAQFDALASEEVRLAGRLSSGASLLLAGNALAPHRAALADTEFAQVDFAATLPEFDAESTRDESRRSIVKPTGRYDAIVLLAPTDPSFESNRLLHAEALDRDAAALAPGGVMLVWVDVNATSPDAAAAVARALERRFGRIRTWFACDGWVGPYLAIEGGALPAPRADAVGSIAVPLDARVVLSIGARTATLLDPVAENAAPTPFTRKTAGDSRYLRAFAAAIERGGQPGVAALFDALAAHADAYLDRVFVAHPGERDVIPAAEVDALLRAIANTPRDSADRATVMAQVRRFVLAAYAKLEYEKLDRVLSVVLSEYPEENAFHLIAGKAAFDLLDDDTAIDELETAVRGDKSQVEAFTVLGRAYTRKRDFASALSALESARALAPDRLDVARALGIALVEAGRGAEAVPYLERVTLELPNDHEAAAALQRARP